MVDNEKQRKYEAGGVTQTTIIEVDMVDESAESLRTQPSTVDSKIPIVATNKYVAQTRDCENERREHHYGGGVHRGQQRWSV